MLKSRFIRGGAWLLCFALALAVLLPALPSVYAFNITSGELKTPGTTCGTPGTVCYTLKNLPAGTAVQDFAISGNYIYVTQRLSATSGDIYVSRCVIDTTSVNEDGSCNAYRDGYMTITNAGYGESLDIFTYNGTTYLLTGLYAQNNGTNDRWSLQIGRVAYKAGATYAHSQIHRFKSLEYAALRNTESKYAITTLSNLSGGVIDRVNACVGDAYTVLRVQLSVSGECAILYSYFDTNALFGLIASTESYDFKNGTSSASAHQNAHIDTFYQCEARKDLVLPNYGFQGMESTVGNDVYVAAGNDGEAPKIAYMDGATYANLCTITNIGKVEIQGLHYQNYHLYFASTTGGDATNRNGQKIYRASTCLVGHGGHSVSALNGYAATCTTAGRTNGTKCDRCGDILSGYEVIPALNHSFNSGTVTKAASGMTDGTMTIACSRGDRSFTVPIPTVNIPLSYAKPLQANLLSEVAYSNGSDTSVAGTQLASFSFADTADQSLATAELYNSSGGAANSLLFKPKAMLSKIIRFNSNISATVTHTASGVTYNIPVTMPVPIQIVPATSVYYETDFSSSVFTPEMKGTSNAWQTSGTTQEENQYWDAASGKSVYGYDASYADDSGLSNGSALRIEGEGVPLFVKDTAGESHINFDGAEKYTGISFSFVGTGFDIIGRTGPKQGCLRVAVCDATGAVKKNVTVANKGSKELYQIPVISVEMDTHGAYTVYIFVNAPFDFSSREDGKPDGDGDVFGGGLDFGGEFFFDAVRIYNPINTAAGDADSAYAYALYQYHGEGDPVFTEVRQKLIDASKETSSETMEGVVYLDAKDDSTTQIAEYTAVGPNNEVYLAPGKSIAFKLAAKGSIPASIDIGAKSADGTPVTMRMNVAGVQSDTNIASCTAMFYSLNIASDRWQSAGGESYVTVSISNSGASGILSITDVKYAYNTPPVTPTGESRSLRFLVDSDVLPPVEKIPAEDENLTFGEQLALENDLTMAFRVKQEKLSAYDISTAYLVVEREVYETGAKEAAVETVILREYQTENDRLIFTYSGISAAQMNDRIRATLHIRDAEGREYVSPAVNTSVASYLDGLLRNSASDTKLITLIMDMVNYGAAAQVYFDRHADAPVNEAFESFKTYASYASSDFKTAPENLATTENAEGKAGKLNLGLALGTRIGIQYKVTVPANVNMEDVTLVVTDASGKVLETLTVAGNATDSRGRYIVNFFGSTSRDMRRVVYATAYAKGEAITGTYAYSISTYAWGIQENASTQPAELLNVTRAMLLYGDSASAYFGQTKDHS